MQAAEIEDAVFEEIDETQLTTDPTGTIEVNETKKRKPMTKADMLTIIKNAIADGHIDSASAAKARAEMGIYKSDFTKKKHDKVKAKSKRKSQKAARKKGRK